MPWRNPLQNSTRLLHGKKVLKCRQCGSCCPKSCRHLSFNEGKAGCKVNQKVQKGELRACDDPPNLQYKFGRPMIGGLREKGKKVFNCAAMQSAVDEVFGKGRYSIELIPGNNKRKWIAYRLAEKIEELLKAKSKAEFEGKKQQVKFVLEEMREAK